MAVLAQKRLRLKKPLNRVSAFGGQDQLKEQMLAGQDCRFDRPYPGSACQRLFLEKKIDSRELLFYKTIV